jgi:hypothetical protein
MDESKKGSLSNLRDILDTYVVELRNANNSFGKTIFSKENDKYYLETFVWDILFRLEASAYHHDKLIDLVNTNLEKMKDSVYNFMIPVGRSASAKIIIEDKKIVFELIAFLSSIRSMVDSLAKLISFYIKEGKFYSFNDLRKYLEKKESFEISILVHQQWMDWIDYLKNYRDYLIHTLTFSSMAECETISVPVIRNGKKVMKRIKNVACFYIPKSPKFEYFLKGFGQEPFTEETTTIFETKDANGKVIERDVTISKTVDQSSMVEIRFFVNTYLDKAVSLVIQTIEILRKNRFIYLTKT